MTRKTPVCGNKELGAELSRPEYFFQSFSFTSERLPQYKLESTKKSKFLLVHYSTAKGLWDWGIILLTIYIAIMVPFNVAFQGENRVRALVAVDMVIQMFFITDIVVHFRTTYVDPSGKIIYDQKKIAAHYLKSWFILDFLAALPFEALYFINQSWVGSMASYIKPLPPLCFWMWDGFSTKMPALQGWNHSVLGRYQATGRAYRLGPGSSKAV